MRIGGLSKKSGREIFASNLLPHLLGRNAAEKKGNKSSEKSGQEIFASDLFPHLLGRDVAE